MLNKIIEIVFFFLCFIVFSDKADSAPNIYYKLVYISMFIYAGNRLIDVIASIYKSYKNKTLPNKSSNIEN